MSIYDHQLQHEEEDIKQERNAQVSIELTKRSLFPTLSLIRFFPNYYILTTFLSFIVCRQEGNKW